MHFPVSLALFSFAVSPLANDQIPLQNTYGHEHLAFSPPHYPSPWMDPAAAGWEDAYIWAKDFVSQLTLTEKVNLTTGVG